MPVMTSVEATIQPDKWGDAQQWLADNLGDTRERNGFVKLDTYLDHESCTLLLIEHWNTAQDQQDYLGWRAGNGTLDTLAATFAGDPQIRNWEISDL